MHECHGTNEREALPLLVRGLLGPAEAARVEAHVAACAACAEERTVLARSATLFDAATPRVDVAAIVAKLPAPPARPTLTVVRGGSRPRVPRYALAAAASLVLVATLSFAALKSRVFGPTAGGVDVAPDTAVPSGAVTSATASPAVASAAIVAGSDLSDLGVSELETLLSELDRLEATVAAEPVSVPQPVITTPEGL